jgi:hypothetical protein
MSSGVPRLGYCIAWSGEEAKEESKYRHASLIPGASPWREPILASLGFITPIGRYLRLDAIFPIPCAGAQCQVKKRVPNLVLTELIIALRQS